MSFIGESRFDLHRHVDWCIFRKVVHFDVIDQFLDLLRRHSFAQEGGDFLDFLPDILLMENPILFLNIHLGKNVITFFMSS